MVEEISLELQKTPMIKQDLWGQNVWILGQILSVLHWTENMNSIQSDLIF